MIDVIILINTPKLTQDDYGELLSLVSFEEQEKIKRLHLTQDAHNCLLGDILSRVEICRISGLQNEQLEFSKNKYGKPFLISNSHIHYNISHSGYYIACAISDEPVGIDIELIKPVELKIAERFFTPDEIKYILNSEHTHSFIEVWTKKESQIKLKGHGLHKPLNSFSVHDTAMREAVFYYMVYNNGEAICHVCSNNNAKPSVRIINTYTLLQLIKRLHAKKLVTQ